MLLSTHVYARLAAGLEGDASMLAPAADYLMILSSLALLAPAKYAFNAGRPWHAALFATMAIICTVYHVCDAKDSKLLSSSVQCKHGLHFLTLADHGCAYFCFVQMALLLLGPEDHNLQWPHDASTSRKPWPRVPANVAIHSRALPLLSILLFLVFYSDWSKFHYRMTLLCVAMVLNGFAQFWLSQSQSEHAPKVLFRAVFWRRLASLGFVPLLACLVLFVFMESLSFGSGFAHSAWHVLVAALAVNVQRTIYHSIADPLQTILGLLQKQPPVSDIHSLAPTNPAVAHWLLGGPAFTASLTLLATYVTASMTSSTDLGWPVLGVDTLQWQCGYILAIGALFTCFSFAITWGLIGTVHKDEVDKSSRLHSHFTMGHDAESRMNRSLLGSILGWVSAACGLFIAVSSAEGVSVHLRTLAVVGMPWTAAMSTLLFAFSDPCATSKAPSPVVTFRQGIAAIIAVASTGFVASLSMLQHYGSLGVFQHTSLPTAWQMMAASQYCTIALLAAFPLTYAAHVHDRWKTKPQLNVAGLCL